MFIRALAIGLALMVGGCATRLDVEADAKTHVVFVEFMSGGHCTGTRVGPHDVLLATNCVDDKPGALMLDGVPVNVLAQAESGEDQAWLTVDATFTEWAELGPLPEQGDEGFIYGNPGDLRGMLRRGYVSGTHEGWLVIDMNNGKGDSGSAVFNAKGQIVGVVSWGYNYYGFVITMIQPVVRGA